MRFMNLLTPGQLSSSLFNHTFILVFTGEVSILMHFPFGPGYKDYSFLDQTVEDIEHDLDAPFDEADTVSSSYSSGFLHSVLVLIVLDCSWLLASYLINYGTR